MLSNQMDKMFPLLLLINTEINKTIEAGGQRELCKKNNFDFLDPRKIKSKMKILSLLLG